MQLKPRERGSPARKGVLHKSLLLCGSLSLVLLLGAQSGWTKSKLDDISKIGKRNVAGRSIISQEKENAIGGFYARQLEARVNLIADVAVNQYVDRVAQNIGRNSDLKIPLTVKVIESSEPDVLILPGGYVYVNSGWIQFVDDEAQLAGALAYGIARLATRQWAEQMTKQVILQYAMVPLINTPQSFGVFYGIMHQSPGGAPPGFLKFNREAVVEADYLGVQYLYKTGYDPHSYVTLLGKIAKIEDAHASQPPKIFRDRPPAQERIAACEKEIKKILPARNQGAVASAEFADIQARLKTLSGTKPADY